MDESKTSLPDSLLVLPDVVLSNISEYLINPVDLLNYGKTCTRLTRLTSVQRLWWDLAIYWLKGLWFSLENLPDSEHPREWFLTLLNNIKAATTETASQVKFENGEVWARIDSDEFRCLLGLLQLSHMDNVNMNHPGVLYEKWLYDMGLYKRLNPSLTFAEELPNDAIMKLCELGQAKERDLRARKQPNKSHTYYVQVTGASSNWTFDLFPAGLSGSTCPLLICPFRFSWNMESSGVSGLLTCLSWVTEQQVVAQHRMKMTSLNTIAAIVKTVVNNFHDFLLQNLHLMELKWGPYCLWAAVRNLASTPANNDDYFDFDTSQWQNAIDQLGSVISLDCKSLMSSLEETFEMYDGIDGTVDFIRHEKRRLLKNEVEKVIFSMNNGTSVTRINLTDSDFIGGDNNRQEMSAAAFVTGSSVLVTWQLIGRLRY